MNEHTPDQNPNKRSIRSERILHIFLVSIGAIIIALIIFQAGIFVGFHKASFDKSWDQHYTDNFGPGFQGPLGMRPSQLPNAHGAIGKIISVSLPTMIIEGVDNTEKVVVIDSTTHIKELTNNVTSSALAPDDSVVVIGDPNTQGQITARFIRIIPSPPAPATSQ